MEEIIKLSLEIGAIKLNTENPFCWASGYYMPMYNDNRQLVGTYKGRTLITEGFANLINADDYDYIAGTATAGIAPATSLADKLKKPLVYVRSKSKDHGTQNLIEGVSKDANLKGKRMILVEDAISTGGSSLQALQTLRDRGIVVDTIIAIYSYGFEKAKTRFKEANANLITLFDYKAMVEYANSINYINKEQYQSLLQWSNDPFSWGDNHGFKKREN